MTLTATPATGSTFAGWSGGGCSGNGTCIVTMTAATTVTATFTAIPVTLTVTVRGSAPGAVTSNPAGLNCPSTPFTCSASFNAGTTVTLTAAPGSHARFKGWGGACSGTAPTCTLTMNDAQSVTATFSMVFTDATDDDRLPDRTRIKSAHFTELLDAINNVLPGTNLNWPTTAPTVGGRVLAVHLNTLRQTLGLAPVAPRTVIAAGHLNEVRLAIRTRE